MTGCDGLAVSLCADRLDRGKFHQAKSWRDKQLVVDEQHLQVMTQALSQAARVGIILSTCKLNTTILGRLAQVPLIWLARWERNSPIKSQILDSPVHHIAFSCLNTELHIAFSCLNAETGIVKN